MTALLDAHRHLAALVAQHPSSDHINAHRHLLTALDTLADESEDAQPLAPEPTQPLESEAGATFSRESANQDRESASGPRDSASYLKLVSEFSTPLTNSLSREDSRESATGSRNQLPPLARAGTEHAELAKDVVYDVVRPLIEFADQNGLVGLTDGPGLVAALKGYTEQELRVAVSRVTRMARAGQVHSPIGWLVKAARRGDVTIFDAGSVHGSSACPTAASDMPLVDDVAPLDPERTNARVAAIRAGLSGGTPVE